MSDLITGLTSDQRQSLRVLISGDDSEDSQLIQRELRQAGISAEYRMVDTQDGFIHELDAFHPDIILSDVSIRGFSGLAALELKFEKNPFIPFIFITEPMNEETAVRCIKLGADDYITKENLFRLGPAVESAIKSKALDKSRHEEMESLDRIARQWRITFDAIRDPVALLDADYKILRCNAAMTEMIGKPYEKILGHRCFSVVHGLSEPPPDCPIGNMNQTSRGIKWQTAIGERYYDIVADPVFDEQNNLTGFIHILTDITTRKQSEDALRTSENKIRTIANNIPGMVYSGRADWSVEFVSKSEEICGYSEEELLTGAVNWMDIIHPEDRATVLGKDSAFNQERGARIREYRIINKNGETRWIEDHASPKSAADGSIEGVDGVIFDVTERVRMEGSLLQLAAAVEQVAESVIITDTDMKIQYVNPAFEAATSYKREEVVGRNASMLWTEDFEETAYARMMGTIAGGDSWQGRFATRKKNNEKINVEATISPIFDENQAIVNYVAVGRDITNELNMEKQMRQVQKIEAVGRLAGGIAHDFNNLLTVINGYAKTLLSQYQDDEDLREDLAEIVNAGERAATLTRQLLAFSRKQTVAPQVLDLNDTVEGMLKMLGRLIGEDIDLTWMPGESLWPVNIDPAQLDQILANLCVNARDAIADTGKIVIQTSTTSFSKAYCQNKPEINPGDYVVLEVNDDGCGMEKETVEKAFDPFYTTKDVGKGTGLGLATVYGIVKQNNGFITVNSERGRGATFKIHLPRHMSDVIKIEKADEIEPAESRGETVLIVEDSLPILKLAARVLNRFGYNVLTGKTPAEALRAAERHSGDIHLLLTDVVMPEMNGRELADRLQSAYPDLAVIFMSGYTADAIAHRGVLADNVAFLQKPFTEENLAAKVKVALAKKQSHS